MSAPLRVMTLNVAHGRGTGFHQLMTPASQIRDNLTAIARLIQGAEPDVVALQELDAPSDWSGGFDHLAFLASESGYPYHHHALHVRLKTPRIFYGTGILSRHPLEGGDGQAFAMNWADTKGFAWARVRAPELAFSFVSLHLDFKRASERRAQLEALSRFLADRPGPLVVAGDFNSALESREGSLPAFAARHELITDGGSLKTFPSSSPSARLDEVLVSATLSPDGKRVLTSRVSDHLPVLLELRGAEPSSVVD